MEGHGDRHRQRALESLTRHANTKRTRSSTATVGHSVLDGHSIWSDDAMSTRHITIQGGIDSRFNTVDLGHPPVPTPSNVRTPSRPFSVSVTGPNNNGVEILWSGRDADAESQYSTDAEPEGRMARLSRVFTKPYTVWERLKGKGKTRIGWGVSLKTIATFSWLNVLLIFVPIAWGVEHTQVSHVAKFMLCFIAIMPLSKILDYGGEQLAMYCGRALGDLIVITLNNAVETALAIILLSKCELKLLQSTFTGVVLLRLLLVPGFAFLTGGAGVLTQDLHPHVVQLNNTLLTIGALALLLPTTFFSALDRMVPAGTIGVAAAVSDSVRGDFLKISRALAIFLLIIYVCSRFYLHNPPGDTDSLQDHPNAPASFKADVAKLEEDEPELNPWFCIVMLIITVVLLGVTTEFLAGSVNPMRKLSGIKEAWFGIFLLPLVSFSADGLLTTVYFVRRHLKHYLGHPAPKCTELAQGRSIDLGIQFMLFWMPLLVLLAWFSHKPLSLLFDVFEVAVLLGACFLVNYVTADSKTNWAEGLMMVTFYFMIASVLMATTVWFYPGQTDVQHMLACTSVQASLAAPPKNFRIASAPLVGIQGY
ncbi:hypothetical protein D9615_000100 [Tricholomella constricta]|uniref:Sodium/calcium exchanger membrane region domain-containing protein n=1 Tax=Tricholomella constricta TaxID=117010 RepID=A0A8H5HR48_9AGAR|nr:hypothetical protein D9615_000100 [Tricholomella constricta]